MSGNVVKLVPAKKRSQAGVIQTMRAMALVAKQEQLTGIAIVAVDAAGYTHTAYESGDNIATLIGGVEHVKYRLLKHQDSE